VAWAALGFALCMPACSEDPAEPSAAAGASAGGIGGAAGATETPGGTGGGQAGKAGSSGAGAASGVGGAASGGGGDSGASGSGQAGAGAGAAGSSGSAAGGRSGTQSCVTWCARVEEEGCLSGTLLDCENYCRQSFGPLCPGAKEVHSACLLEEQAFCETTGVCTAEYDTLVALGCLGMPG
jgi:hypothetical protein